MYNTKVAKSWVDTEPNISICPKIKYWAGGERFIFLLLKERITEHDCQPEIKERV